MDYTIKNVLFSTFYKEGLEPLIEVLKKMEVNFYSTGGTAKFLKEKGVEVHSVEGLTGYSPILGGRVKTLHPKVFGGILAKNTKEHREEREQHEIPKFDMVVVNLYPFSETIKNSEVADEIIEDIDIGGVSLIRAAAKNYHDVLVVSDPSQYSDIAEILPEVNLETRRRYATEAFYLTAQYDKTIYQWYFSQFEEFPKSEIIHTLRYGENPHQRAYYAGEREALFTKLQGKELSYNNMVDIDAAFRLMNDLQTEEAACAIFKHTNSCGVAIRKNVESAWTYAMASDPVSAFGGIIIFNKPIDKATALRIDEIFYEILIAPEFNDDVLDILGKNKKRILLKSKKDLDNSWMSKSLLEGTVAQQIDTVVPDPENWEVVTDKEPDVEEKKDLKLAMIICKHLKSNAIVLVKEQQLIGMGCGQTSRIDALNQAIEKSKKLDFNLQGSVMASDAFFPFSDCVSAAFDAGVTAVIQPGGSIRDSESIEFCDSHYMSMVTTGIRHFKH